MAEPAVGAESNVRLFCFLASSVYTALFWTGLAEDGLTAVSTLTWPYLVSVAAPYEVPVDAWSMGALPSMFPWRTVSAEFLFAVSAAIASARTLSCASM